MCFISIVRRLCVYRVRLLLLSHTRAGSRPTRYICCAAVVCCVVFAVTRRSAYRPLLSSSRSTADRFDRRTARVPDIVLVAYSRPPRLSFRPRCSTSLSRPTKSSYRLSTEIPSHPSDCCCCRCRFLVGPWRATVQRRFSSAPGYHTVEIKRTNITTVGPTTDTRCERRIDDDGRQVSARTQRAVATHDSCVRVLLSRVHSSHYQCQWSNGFSSGDPRA